MIREEGGSIKRHESGILFVLTWKRIQWTKEDDVYRGLLILSWKFSRWSTGATQVDATQIVQDTIIQLLSFIYLTILSCKPCGLSFSIELMCMPWKMSFLCEHHFENKYLNNSGSRVRLKMDMKPVPIFWLSEMCAQISFSNCNKTAKTTNKIHIRIFIHEEGGSRLPL